VDPQLDEFEAERLEVVQHAEELCLVLDGSREQRVAAAPAVREGGKGLEDGGTEETPDVDLTAP
jgi:hypothetical protein